jgi:hypothetical protein
MHQHGAVESGHIAGLAPEDPGGGLPEEPGGGDADKDAGGDCRGGWHDQNLKLIVKKEIYVFSTFTLFYHCFFALPVNTFCVHSTRSRSRLLARRRPWPIKYQP